MKAQTKFNWCDQIIWVQVENSLLKKASAKSRYLFEKTTKIRFSNEIEAPKL